MSFVLSIAKSKKAYIQCRFGVVASSVIVNGKSCYSYAKCRVYLGRGGGVCFPPKRKIYPQSITPIMYQL